MYGVATLGTLPRASTNAGEYGPTVAQFQLWRGWTGCRKLAVPLDVVQEGENIVVKASVPGVSPEDIDVSIENDVLTIKGQTKEEREHQEGNYLMRERRSGSFYRALRLPDTVDSDKAQPHYENGVLSITFPRMESKRAKRLQITGGQGSESQTSE